MERFHDILNARASRWPRQHDLAMTLILLVLVSCPVWALNPDRALRQYVHDAWQIEDGLPCNVVMAVLQTRDGYLWLGTESGLVRFDGVSFTRYDSENTPAFRAVAVSSLCEDHGGTLWIGTWGGGLVRMRDGEWSHLGADDGLPSDYVRSLCVDLAGDVWVGTRNGISRCCDGRVLDDEAVARVGDSMVAALLVDSSGILWVGTYGNGLQAYSTDSALVSTPAPLLPGAAILSLHEDQRGRIWIGTRGDGLSLLADGEITQHLGGSDLADASILTIVEDNSGNVWAGTESRGLIRLSMDDARVTGRDTAVGNAIWALCEDREGLLWIGSYGNGLNRLKDAVCSVLTREQCLSDDRVLCILEDDSGKVYIGSEAGLDLLEPDPDGYRRIASPPVPERVLCLCHGRDGTIWIGTYGGGLYHLNKDRIVRYTRDHGLPSNMVMSLFLDRGGALWIGTERGGLTRFDGETFTVYGQDSGVAEDMIVAIEEDPAGTLWIGTHGRGLFRMNGDSITALTPEHVLSNNSVRSIYADSDSVVWIATYGGGLNRLARGVLTAFATREGLVDNVIYQCLEDDHGTLWLSSNRGIFSVEKSTLAAYVAGRAETIPCARFGKSDGLKSIECNGPGGCRTRDGRLWFPTVRGAVMIDPDMIPTNPLIPPVHLECAVVDSNLIYPMSLRGLPLEFAPGTRHFSFHYAGLSFVDPQKVRFRHRLEGFEEDWVDAGARRNAYYTNLGHGAYCFRVIACNNDGVWNAVGDSIRFTVRPRFSETFPFYGLCALSIMLVGVGGHAVRVRNLRSRHRMLERIVAERTSQLLEHSKEIQRANLKLRRLVTVDGLTGVANRRLFDDVLAREWDRAWGAGHLLSLILVDVDFFKAYNDSNGHLTGDDCLVQVATILDTTVARGGDLVARFGGDEFAVILPETGVEDAFALAERMRERVAAHGICHASSGISDVVTVSAGVSTRIPQSGGSHEDLIHEADQALYRAKHTGRNRVVTVPSDT